MDISVIISTYNRSAKLRKTLESLISMDVSDGTEWEVLVVNNNSSDNTDKVMDEFMQLNSLDLKCLIEKKQGKSFALNTAIKNASGDIIAFIDNDVIVDKNWMKGVIKGVNTYKNSGGFGGRIVFADNHKHSDLLKSDKTHNALRGFLRDNGHEDREFINALPSGANMFFKREIIAKNGFFRTDLGPIGNTPGTSEDTEFCRRLIKRREKLMYIAGAVVYHPVETERISKKSLLRWRYNCARSEVRARDLENNTRSIYRVPRYLIRQLITNACIWISSFDSQKRFYYKLKTYYAFGEMTEHRSLSKNKRTGN